MNTKNLVKSEVGSQGAFGNFEVRSQKLEVRSGLVRRVVLLTFGFSLLTFLSACRQDMHDAPRYDPLTQARQLLDIAEAAPKGVKWKLRSNVGDRVRWYELPEEVAH